MAFRKLKLRNAKDMGLIGHILLRLLLSSSTCWEVAGKFLPKSSGKAPW